MLRGRWKEAARIHWISRRPNLEPLEESAFTNEYFTPHYVRDFHGLPAEAKDILVRSQKLSSDGITTSYLLELNRELYRHVHVERSKPELIIQTNRDLQALDEFSGAYQATFMHEVRGEREQVVADVVILATGFQSRLPTFMEPLLPRLALDASGRLSLNENFQVTRDGP